jgi:acyl transferase domain-containing protein
MTIHESPGRSPIAIIGMGCRMPQADGVDAFWELLRNGSDAISEVPSSRWDVDALWSADAAAPGKTYCRWGGFIDDGDQFDAAVFDIDAREAEFMDPQQGMVLECAWHALEHAGIAPSSLRGSNTGSFVGISNSDFDRKLCHDLNRLRLLAGTGTSYSIVANRLSYSLGLCGPSIAIDLACASSLIAVHLACQSLLSFECDLALAGGVHLILSPEKTITFSQGKLLAGDGRCKSFADSADGYVRGEGCGMIALKRLCDAELAHDPIVAVILGSATNHNGASNGLSAPFGVAQEKVLHAAYSSARSDPTSIGYIEAHSPGTFLGDLIEVRALAKVLTPGRERGNPCFIGSVKSNIGHLEGAAGIAGLIKIALVVHYEFVPKTLHVSKLARSLPLSPGVLEVATQAVNWPAGGSRRAGVSSFSFGGANAHVLIEGPPPVQEITADKLSSELILLLSARSSSALEALAARYISYFDERPAINFLDVCYTAALGRSHLAHRLAVTASAPEDAKRELLNILQQQNTSTTRIGIAPARAPAIELWLNPAHVSIDRLELPLLLQQRANRLQEFYSSSESNAAVKTEEESGNLRSLVLLMLLRTIGLAPSVIRIDMSRTDDILIQSLRNTTTTQRTIEALNLELKSWRHFEVLPMSERSAGRPPAFVVDFTTSESHQTMAQIVAAAYVAGIVPQWQSIFGAGRRISTAPKYPFQRQRYWTRSVAPQVQPAGMKTEEGGLA